MKKYISLLLIVLMFCAVVSVGCGGGSSDSPDTEQTESLNENTGGEDTGDYDPNEGGKGTSGTGEIDLSKITADYIAHDGETLTGELGGQYTISVADGATVTLKDVTIEFKNLESTPWAGLNCQGDATLILEGTNYVQHVHRDYPAVHVPVGHTLTIKGTDNGTGKLTADAHMAYAAGIGSGHWLPCGNIVIDGGTIDAIGGMEGAGIGGTHYGRCDSITINHGTVSANGGYQAPGVGGNCGTITINGEEPYVINDPFFISL